MYLFLDNSLCLFNNIFSAVFYQLQQAIWITKRSIDNIDETEESFFQRGSFSRIHADKEVVYLKEGLLERLLNQRIKGNCALPFLVLLVTISKKKEKGSHYLSPKMSFFARFNPAMTSTLSKEYWPGSLSLKKYMKIFTKKWEISKKIM